MTVAKGNGGRVEICDRDREVKRGLVGKLVEGYSNISLLGFGRWGCQIDGCPQIRVTTLSMPVPDL